MSPEGKAVAFRLKRLGGVRLLPVSIGSKRLPQIGGGPGVDPIQALRELPQQVSRRLSAVIDTDLFRPQTPRPAGKIIEPPDDRHIEHVSGAFPIADYQRGLTTLPSGEAKLPGCLSAAVAVNGEFVLARERLERGGHYPKRVDDFVRDAAHRDHCRVRSVGNPFNDPAVIERILETGRTIAVVGLSPDPSRPSHRVADYLQRAGYQVIPVNPKVEQVLGQKSAPSLRHIVRPVDVVDIFRRSEFVAAVVDDALAIGARVIWMQEGVVDQASAERARAAGLDVVMDSCMMAEHSLRHRGLEKQTSSEPPS